MTTAWRLIGLETYDAAMNMAIDEAVLQARIAGKVPNTLRFYKWQPSAVSIGRFQNIEKEVNLDNCRKQGVDVVRRITGGGAVYHDSEDEITYSVVVARDDLGENIDVMGAYKKISGGLINALNLLGVKADFSPGDTQNCPNIAVKERKISGSSQSFKGSIVLQHGTLLLEADLEKMFTFLRVPWASTRMEIVNIAGKKITSVKQELGVEVSVERAYEALVEGFKDALQMNLSKGVLTEEELETTEKLRKKKFANQDWTTLGTLVMV